MQTMDEVLQQAGAQIRSRRKELHLSQQDLADDLHRGKRHIQRIESGKVNPSFDVLYALIHRLGLSADALFYPDMPDSEQELHHLMAKLAACTADEQQIIIQTMDYMATQFLSRHQTQQSNLDGEKELASV